MSNTIEKQTFHWKNNLWTHCEIPWVMWEQKNSTLKNLE